MYKNILILSDIEGSSGCWSYDASAFMTPAWRWACVAMTEDVRCVVTGLFNAGAKGITVVDFHRTGYNLLRERIDPRARIISGYRRGPVPGVGKPNNVEAVMFVGMHAAAGTKGFLAHTFTSRLACLEVNGKPVSEVEFFAASVAPYDICPVFFSGCPEACTQARAVIEMIHTYPIDKTSGPDHFDAAKWRVGLADAAVASLENTMTQPYRSQGPFHATVTMREGSRIARKLARRWGFGQTGDRIFIEAANIHELYQKMIRLCYLTPRLEKVLPLGLLIYNLIGRIGLAWVRHGLKKGR
jgi:D-amino peptidase